MRLIRLLTIRAALAAPALALGAGMLMSGAGCSFSAWTNLETKTVALEIEHMDDSAIDVETANGAVSVRADPSVDRVAVSAEIRATTLERLEATQIVAERAQNGTLTLRVVWPDEGKRSNEGASFDIMLPNAKGVTVATGNGKVVIAGASGPATLTTSNGSITVEGHAGPVNASTSNGRVEVADVAGPAKLRTSNGRVVATRVHGTVEARTSNGAIEIALEPGVQGACSAVTSNGSITFEAPSSLRASLDLSTSNGKIVVNRSGETMEFKKSAKVELNGGGPTCTVSTSNGRVTVEVIDDPDGSDDEPDTDA